MTPTQRRRSEDIDAMALAMLNCVAARAHCPTKRSLDEFGEESQWVVAWHRELATAALEALEARWEVKEQRWELRTPAQPYALVYPDETHARTVQREAKKEGYAHTMTRITTKRRKR